MTSEIALPAAAPSPEDDVRETHPGVYTSSGRTNDDQADEPAEAEDTGSAIQGNKIDIAVGSHDQALTLGIDTADVYLLG